MPLVLAWTTVVLECRLCKVRPGGLEGKWLAALVGGEGAVVLVMAGEESYGRGDVEEEDVSAVGSGKPASG